MQYIFAGHWADSLSSKHFCHDFTVYHCLSTFMYLRHKILGFSSLLYLFSDSSSAERPCLGGRCPYRPVKPVACVFSGYLVGGMHHGRASHAENPLPGHRPYPFRRWGWKGVEIGIRNRLEKEARPGRTGAND